MVKEYKIKQIKNGILSEIDDKIVEESPLSIYINSEEIITILSSPEKEIFLAIGFLKSEGLIERLGDIKNYKFEEEDRKIFIEVEDKLYDKKKLERKHIITTGCSRGISFFTYKDALFSKEIKNKKEIPPHSAISLMKEFQNRSELFKMTGGLHSAALACDESILLFSEDIGRHNAVDKIIGEALVKNIPLSNKILLISGRISSEIILKAGRNGIPAVISRSAPTSTAINIARDLNITLFGFVRGRKLNIYN